jgi:predicted TIM-barrel fold metal-dependent hydrolase
MPGPAGPPGPPGPAGVLAPPESIEITGAALDAHTTLASPVLQTIITGQGGNAATAQDLIAQLDAANVENAIVVSRAYDASMMTNDNDIIVENNYVSDEVSRFPERLVGFCGINPLRLSAPGEVDRCLDRPGMVGVFISLSGSQVNMADPQNIAAINRTFDRIQGRGAPVLLQSGTRLGLTLSSEGFANLVNILASHPDVRVAHAQCAGLTDDQRIENWLSAFRATPGLNPENHFVEVSSCLQFYESAPLAKRDLMVWRLKQWGLERVLIGSDYFNLGPVQTPAEALQSLEQYPFTQAEVDTITGNDGSAWLGQ